MDKEKTSIPLMSSYWVEPGRLRAGSYPGSILETEAREKSKWLLEQGIDYILDLTEEGEAGLLPYESYIYEEAEKINRQVIHKRISLKDFSTPPKEKMIEILDTLDQALIDGKIVYLHCYGGKGRTGTVVGCYLVRHGKTGEAALGLIKELRRGIPGEESESPETEEQRRMVLEWKTGY